MVLFACNNIIFINKQNDYADVLRRNNQKKWKLKKNIWGWPTDEDRIRRNLMISPKNKLLWLQEFNEFIYKFLADEEKKKRFKRRNPGIDLGEAEKG